MFLQIYKSNVPFEFLYGTLYQLRKCCNLGDTLELDGVKYIITSSLNPTITEKSFKEQMKFSAGYYVQLARLDWIEIFRSDTKFNIDGFICVPITKRFYKIKAFDEGMNEIIDNNDFKDKTEYYYKRVIK